WLQALDRERLADPVRGALRSETAQVIDWEWRPIRFRLLAPHTGGVYRLRGTAREGSKSVPWSLVMKLVAVGDERRSHHAYWQREALIYESGLLDDLPDGLAAPRCFGIDTLPEGGHCFWLEEIVENTGENWTMSRYGLAARHFGRFNGRYLTDRPAPSQAWLSRRRFRDQFAEWPSFRAWIDDPNTWSDPRIRHAFRRPVAERLL